MVFVTLLGDDEIVIFECAFDDSFDLAQVEGFHQVVEGAQTQCADGAFHRLHAADHHDDSLRREFFDVWNHFESTHAGHGDIADD